VTLTSKKILSFVLVLVSSAMLGACSSKPSPWAEASSPWDNQQEESQEPEPLEIADIEPVEPTPVEDTIEPVDEEPVIEEPEVVEAEPEPEPLIEEPVQLATGDGLAGQPAGYYAVQVVASSSMEQLTDFANAHQISDQWVAETTVEGKIWYVLMLGVYPTKEEAEQAMQSVIELETLPWIRTVASIQASMN